MVLTVDGVEGTICHFHNLWDLVLVTCTYWHRIRRY